MCHKLLAVLLACATQAALAQGIYSWKDAGGQVHYSDMPPNDAQVRTVRQAPLAPPPPARSAQGAATPAQESYADKELAFRKRLAEKADSEEKAKKDKVEREQREQQCTESRRYLAGLEAGQPVLQFNDAGERVLMDEQARLADLERTRRDLARACP